HRALTIFFCIERNRFERSQHTARSINVVHTPAAEPGAVLALVFYEELHAAPHRRMIRGPTEAAEAFHDASRHVRGRGINHRVVIGEWNVAKELAVVVAVKCRPAAVAILHTQQPLHYTAHSRFHAPLFRNSYD